MLLLTLVIIIIVIIIAGNYKCPADKTQSCVHVAALLITVTEITPHSCTSMRCAWSRPPQAGQPTLSVDLDFGGSSLDGYVDRFMICCDSWKVLV